MNKIFVDPNTGTQLSGLQASVELCDPSGRIIGWFQPAVSSENYTGLEPPFSKDELRTADQEQGGRTLDELLADLERRK